MPDELCCVVLEMVYVRNRAKNDVDTGRWATYHGALSHTSTRSTRAACLRYRRLSPRARGAGDLGPAKAASPALFLCLCAVTLHGTVGGCCVLHLSPSLR